MGKFLFWIIVIALLITAYQQNWFKPFSDFGNNIKNDIDYQRNMVPREENINDNGMLTIEKDEKQIVRRSGLGTVHSGR